MKNALLISMLLLAGNTFAAPVGQATLQASTRENIVINYKDVTSPGSTVAVAAMDLVVVTPAGSDCRLPIRAVLISDCGSFGVTSKQVDLAPVAAAGSACNFRSVQTTVLPYDTHAGACKQEVAVVSNGRWLVDPITSSHNFKFFVAR